MLEDFEVLDFVVGVPSVSVTKNGVAFNKPAVEKMKCAYYVRLLIDRNSCRIAIAHTNDDDPKAQRFFREGQKVANGIRWNNKDLLTTITRLMKWNLTERGYKINGEYLEEEDALVFDLKTARPIENKICKTSTGEEHDE